MKDRFLNYIKYFAVGILVLLVSDLNAQEVNGFGEGSKHAIQLELGGRTFIWASLNYEYALQRQFSLGGGLGLLSLLRGDITRNNNGATEMGKYLDFSTTQMIYGNYFIGEKKHKLLLTAGLTNYLITSRNTYPSETEISRRAQLEWNTGVGYQLSGKRNYFRVTAYFMSLPGSNEWFPKYIPWIGLSTGFKLSR